MKVRFSESAAAAYDDALTRIRAGLRRSASLTRSAKPYGASAATRRAATLCPST